MTVGLIVYELDPHGDVSLVGARLIPIATESEFVRLWAAGAERLGQAWIPQFQEGLWLDESCDWDAIMSELDELASWMEAQPDEGFALGRLATLRQELLGLRGDTAHRGWIG